MSCSLFEGGAFGPAKLALPNARGALVNADVALREKRTALAALLPIPWARELVKRVGTRHLSALVSAAAARPLLPPILRQLRQTIFDIWRADLPYLEGDDAFGGEMCS